MYITSGGGYITIIEYLDESFDILEEIQVPDEIFGMNDITKIDDYYYITSTTNKLGEVSPKIVRVSDLKLLITGAYEDVYTQLGLNGTPYFISTFDGSVFLTEIDAYNGVVSFAVSDTALSNVKKNFEFTGATSKDLIRKDMYPL